MTRPSTSSLQKRFTLQVLLTVFSVCILLHGTVAGGSEAITAPPTAEDVGSAEKDTVSSRKKAHDASVEQGIEVGFIVTLRGQDFPSDKSKFSVRINGVSFTDILLHNSTAFSFRIPNSMALNREVLHSSFVKISVSGEVKVNNVPLIVLERSMSMVDLAEYRRRASDGSLSGHTENAASEDVETENPGPASEERIAEDYYEGTSTDDGSGTPAAEENEDGDRSQKRSRRGDEQPGQPEREKELELDVERAERLLSEGSRAGTKEAEQILESAIQEGDARAMTILGTALLSGTASGLGRDFTRAVYLLQDASDTGYPDAQAMLGFLYASGIAGTALRKDIGAALLMWTFAAEGGSMYAKMALGYRYFTGTDVSEDCEKASEYYKDVADEVFQEARESLDKQTGRERQRSENDDDTMSEIRPPTPSAMLKSDRKRLTEGMTQRVMGEANEVVQYYRHSADRGDAAAQVLMGSLYYYGAIDMPQDINRARQLFLMAAKAGRAEAHAHLGFMDLRAGHNASAVEHLRKAAKRGDRLGLHGMGFVSLHGIGVAKDAQLAAEYFTKAMEKEHPEAMFNLAIMYSKGIGVPQSSQEAFRLFQTAARFGHMQSNYNMGAMMLRGEHPATKDCTIATQYLKLVAQQGVWNKILSKAFRAYEKGAYADALYRYLQGAHAGIELAQFNAAFMYEHNTLNNEDGFKLKPWGFGDGGKYSRGLYADRSAVIEEALELYQMSASQGLSDSMVRMGDLVFSETKEFSRAASAYGRAVKLKNAEAMFNLGWMHARGYGMNADRHMAKRYFDQARETNPDAYLPSTIAVYSLKYSESVMTCLDKVSTVMDRVRSFSGGSGSGAEGFGEATLEEGWMGGGDFVAFAILLVVLGIVVSVRKRRLAASRAARRDEGSEGRGLRERVVEGDRGGHEHGD